MYLMFNLRLCVFSLERMTTFNKRELKERESKCAGVTEARRDRDVIHLFNLLAIPTSKPHNIVATNY